MVALSEKEKASIKKVVYEEFKNQILEMEANILAYQELLLAK